MKQLIFLLQSGLVRIFLIHPASNIKWITVQGTLFLFPQTCGNYRFSDVFMGVIKRKQWAVVV